MNLFQLLKKLVSSQSSATVTAPTAKSVSTDVRPDSLPSDVIHLLWFKDGPLANYRPERSHQQRIDIGGITVSLSFSDASEPSAISVADPIRPPLGSRAVEKLPYYPSYAGMTPDQRWTYLDWLRDVDKAIDIGYVFVFYYGLERHLFYGQYEAAFHMVLRLRQQHRHPSFLHYSTAALTAACIIHQRGDLFADLLLNRDALTDGKTSDLFLLAKWSMNLDLTAGELMHLASAVDFSNRRYLKDEDALFEVELARLLCETYGKEAMPLRHYPLALAPIESRTLAANISFTTEQRSVKIPCLTLHPGFRQDAHRILQEAHNRVKEALKNARKRGITHQASGQSSKSTKREPSAVFAAGPLWEAIDVHQFDQNAACHDQGACPACSKDLVKRPVQKGSCHHCGSTLLVKDSEFTGEKLLLTQQAHQAMTDIRTERVRRNWLRQTLAAHGLSEESAALIVRTRKIPAEHVLLEHVQRSSEKHRANQAMGLYRNCLLEVGRIHAQMGREEEALKSCLTVCWYDLLGPTNGWSGGLFNPESAFLAPGVLKMVNQAANHLGLDRAQLQMRFLECATEHHSPGMPLTPEAAWRELVPALPKTEGS